MRRVRPVRQARQVLRAPNLRHIPITHLILKKNNQINYKPNASGKALAETPRAFRPLSGKTPPISRAAPARATNPCHVGTPRGKKARVCILCSVLFGEMSRTNPRRKEKSSLPRSQFFLFHRPPLVPFPHAARVFRPRPRKGELGQTRGRRAAWLIGYSGKRNQAAIVPLVFSRLYIYLGDPESRKCAGCASCAEWN